MLATLIAFLLPLTSLAFPSLLSNKTLQRGTTVRYDILDPLDPNKYTPVLTNITKKGFFASTWQSLQQLTTSHLTDPFKITIDCQAESTLCKQTRRAIKSAGRRIAKILHFNSPISIKVTIGNICKDGELCGTLAHCAPGAKFTASFDNSKPRGFVQALLKQMDVAYTLDYAEFDLLIGVNKDMNWWTAQDGEIGKLQFDLEAVLAHEITHGLGFESTWLYIPPNESDSVLTGHVLPSIRFKDGKGDGKEELVVEDWVPPSYFTSLLFDTQTNKNLSIYLDRITKREIKNMPMDKVAEKLENDKGVVRAASTIHRIATMNNTLGMRLTKRRRDDKYRIQWVPTQDGSYREPFTLSQLGISTVSEILWLHDANQMHILDVFSLLQQLNTVLLYSPSDFQAGSSISHFSQIYRHTPSFLMIARNDAQGRTLDELIQSYSFNGAYPTLGIYGYELTNIMTEMGWPSVLDPRRRTLYIQTDDENNGVRISTSLITLLVLYIVL